MKQSIFDIQHLHLKDYLFKLFPSGKLIGKEFTVGDISGAPGKSLSFNIEKGCGQDFESGQVFDNIVKLVMEKFGLEEQAAFKKIEQDWGVASNSTALALVEKPAVKKAVAVPFTKDTALQINDKLGTLAGRWLYETADGKGLFWILRYDKPDGKQYYPYYYGEDKKWHMKAVDKPRPLYNLPEVTQRTKEIVLVTEGEKSADAARSLLPSLIATTASGGSQAIKDTDWTPLSGRKVLLWRDNDKAGVLWQEKLAIILSDLGCQVRVFKDDAFDDRPLKWDVADLAASQEMENSEIHEWVRFNIIEYQRGGAGSSPSTSDDNKSAQIYEEPLNRHYRCLGSSGNKFAIYNYHSGQVMYFSPDGLSKKSLIALVSGDTWHWKHLVGYKDQDEKSRISWDAIVGIIAKDCYTLGQFDSDRVRGLGCWIDNKRIIFNSGNYLYIEGKKVAIKDFESYFIYQRSTTIIEQMDKEINRDDLARFEKLCDMFAWEYPACGALLAGWLMVAPICGALPWRPHIYIAGMAGTGKSTIHDNLLARTLGNCSIVTLGDSTKAGLAQSVMADALPIIFDEIENDSKIDEMRNDMVLRMARYSSSSQKGKTLKGRADQSGAEGYVSRSCFCFSSITPSVKHYADYSRITLLPLVVDHSTSKEASIAHYKKITSEIKDLMGEDIHDLKFSERFITYANRNALTIISSYRVIKETAQLILPGFSARIADQIGMLLAGFWAYRSEEVITVDEAENLLKKYNWEYLVPNKKQENQMQLIAKLRQHKESFINESSQKRYTRSIAQLIDYVSYQGLSPHKDESYFDKDYAVNILLDMGLKVQEGYVVISNSSQPLSKILQYTQWTNNWQHSLKAIQGATAGEPTWFGKTIGTHRNTLVPIDIFISEKENE